MQLMKNKTAILLVVALVCGLGAAYLTSKVLADRSKAPAEEKVEVFVAKSSVPQYKPLKEPEKYFVKKSMTKSEAPKGAITKIEDLKNKRLKVPLGVDKVVTQSDLLDDKGTGAGMEGLVPEGHRAVAIKVNPETGAGGFILPHTKVDVVATMKRGDTKSTSQIILQDVLVLAVGAKTDRDETTQSMVAQTVTLALVPDDVMLIALASEVSQLRLALRPEGESKQQPLSAKKVSDFLKGKVDPSEEAETVTVAPGKPGLTPNGQALPTTEPTPENKPKPDWTVTVRLGDQYQAPKHYYLHQNGQYVPFPDAKKEEPKKEETTTPPATEKKD